MLPNVSPRRSLEIPVYGWGGSRLLMLIAGWRLSASDPNCCENLHSPWIPLIFMTDLKTLLPSVYLEIFQDHTPKYLTFRCSWLVFLARCLPSSYFINKGRWSKKATYFNSKTQDLWQTFNFPCSKEKPITLIYIYQVFQSSFLKITQRISYYKFEMI